MSSIPSILIERGGQNEFVFVPGTANEKILQLYKKQRAVNWDVGEISMSQDLTHWASLTDDERHFITVILAFFAASDGIVMKNLGTNFGSEVMWMEARLFYGAQTAIEGVHAETYSMLIDTLIKDPVKRLETFNGLINNPAIKCKGDWAMKWMDPERATFQERIVAFAVVEGVFFSGSFASIFWLRQRGIMPGLTFSNVLISRDEGIHCDFACAINETFTEDQRVPIERVAEIFREAVDVETAFFEDALPVKLIGMNHGSMVQYVKFVAGRLMIQLGYESLWPDASNPFPWMDMISLPGKANFFECRVGEYAKAGAGSTEVDDDFFAADN